MSYDKFDLGQLRIPASINTSTQYQSVPINPELVKSAEKDVRALEDQYINQNSSNVPIGGTPAQIRDYWYNQESPGLINEGRRQLVNQENHYINQF